MNIPLPQDRAALIDRDLCVTLPYRRWMSDVTKALLALQGAETVTPEAAPETTYTGTGWIKVTVSDGNVSITQREGLTTDNLPEGTKPYADHTAGVYDFTADANYTLTADEYRNGFLEITDSTVVLTAGRDLVFPAAFPLLLFKNSTAQTLTLKKSGQPGVTVAAGATAVIASGPTDVEKA